jgi:hypothetical protein
MHQEYLVSGPSDFVFLVLLRKIAIQKLPDASFSTDKSPWEEPFKYSLYCLVISVGVVVHICNPCSQESEAGEW